MGRVVIITDVPSDQKDDTVAIEESGGATVTVTAQRDGRFTITATFPDIPDGTPNGGGPSTGTPGGPTGTPGGPTTPASLSDRVPIPPRDQINIRLSTAQESTMTQKFGVPGNLTIDCSPLTGPIKQRVRFNFDVGPFKVNGLDFAVESLLQIFTDVQKQDRALFDQVKTVGMLCVRAQRENRGRFSNHSWGTAIDIFFGTSVVPQKVHLTHRGNLALAPFFNQHGWYWGAGFSGMSVDSMHFELAEETILKISPDQLMF
jgi:hypothetical protein